MQLHRNAEAAEPVSALGGPERLAAFRETPVDEQVAFWRELRHEVEAREHDARSAVVA